MLHYNPGNSIVDKGHSADAFGGLKCPKIKLRIALLWSIEIAKNILTA